MLYGSAVQPATRGPHAARRMISCGPPVLAKFVRNLCKNKDKTWLDIWQYQHKSSSLNLLNRAYMYTVLNPQVRENVMYR